MLILALAFALVFKDVHGKLCEKEFDGTGFNYSSLDFPSRPTTVNIAFNVTQVHSVDETNHFIHVKVDLFMNWTDSRLTGYLSKTTTRCQPLLVHTPPRQPPNIWTPDLIVHDIVDTDDRGVFTNGKAMTAIADDNGMVMAWASLDVIIGCPMRYSFYPWDNHHCQVTFRSEKYSANEVAYEPNKTEHGRNADLPFSIEVADNDVHRVRFESGFRPSAVGFTICMGRILTPFVVGNYMPSFVLVFAAWVSFCIPADMVPGRMSLIVTILLMLINMLGQVRSNSPFNSGLSTLDVWMVGCIILVTGVLFEYAVLLAILYVRNSETVIAQSVNSGGKKFAVLKRRCRRIDKYAARTFIGCTVAFDIIYAVLVLAHLAMQKSCAVRAMTSPF